MPERTLTFLHGFMGHPGDWDELRSSLESARSDQDQSFAMVTPEILPAEDWRSGIQQLAEKIPNRSVIIGYSMGARLALSLALEFPEKVGGLILISGNPGLESEVDRKKRLAHDQKLAEEIENISTLQRKREFLEKWYQQPVFASISDPIRSSQIARKLGNQNLDQWSGSIRTFSVGLQPNYWPRLNLIRVPVWLIAGEKDEKYGEIATRFAAESSSESTKAVIVPECGHIVHCEQTETVAEVIHQFLKTLPTS